MFLSGYNSENRVIVQSNRKLKKVTFYKLCKEYFILLQKR